ADHSAISEDRKEQVPFGALGHQPTAILCRRRHGLVDHDRESGLERGQPERHVGPVRPRPGDEGGGGGFVADAARGGRSGWAPPAPGAPRGGGGGAPGWPDGAGPRRWGSRVTIVASDK